MQSSASKFSLTNIVWLIFALCCFDAKFKKANEKIKPHEKIVVANDNFRNEIHHFHPTICKTFTTDYNFYHNYFQWQFEIIMLNKWLFAYSVRMEHLKCDLDAVRGSCSKGVMGLKTEFECKLIQDRCQGLQRSAYNSICNTNSYAKSDRPTNRNPQNGGNAGNTQTVQGRPGNGAGVTTVSAFVSILGVVSSFAMFLL